MSDPVHMQYNPSVLRVEPHALPALRAAFDRASRMLDEHLGKMSKTAYIQKPWIADEDSEELRVFYNERVMDAPDGPYQALVSYLGMLHSVRDQLAAAEAEYRRVEGENSDLWGRA